MTADRTYDRRTVLRSVGTVAVAGALAGCSGGGSSGGGGDGGGSGGGGGGGGGSGGNGGGSGGGGSNAGMSPPSKVSSYLSEANNFTGSMTDATGQSGATVKVGAGSNGLAFGPAAIAVSTGTTVTWDWTGKGGTHNVYSKSDGKPLDSGSPVSGSDVTYEYTFEETGTYLYYCQPHKTLGMKGAVVVK